MLLAATSRLLERRPIGRAAIHVEMPPNAIRRSNLSAAVKRRFDAFEGRDTI